MNRVIIKLSAALLFLTTSCTTVYKGGYSVKPNLTIDYNVKADLIIDTTKVLQGYSQSKVVFGIFKSGDKNFSDAFGEGVGEKEKMAATYKALDSTKFDIIVNPKYRVTVNKTFFSRTTTAVVSGYGAKIKIK
jgi:hypothetical protein